MNHLGYHFSIIFLYSHKNEGGKEGKERREQKKDREDERKTDSGRECERKRKKKIISPHTFPIMNKHNPLSNHLINTRHYRGWHFSPSIFPNFHHPQPHGIFWFPWIFDDSGRLGREPLWWLDKYIFKVHHIHTQKGKMWREKNRCILAYVIQQPATVMYSSSSPLGIVGMSFHNE